MIHSTLYRKTSRTFLALMITGIFLALSLPVHAAHDAIGNRSIKPIPGTKHEMAHDFQQDAERFYDFIGIVDDVQREGIVVGDSYMKFAPNAKVSGARNGAWVGIVLNDDGEAVLCEPYTKTSR